jgi:hypothetical protein
MISGARLYLFQVLFVRRSNRFTFFVFSVVVEKRERVRRADRGGDWERRETFFFFFSENLEHLLFLYGVLGSWQNPIAKNSSTY